MEYCFYGKGEVMRVRVSTTSGELDAKFMHDLEDLKRFIRATQDLHEGRGVLVTLDADLLELLIVDDSWDY